MFELLASERLSVQHFTILQGHFAVTVRAHLVGQFGHGEESLKHLVDVRVSFSRYLEVGALLIAGHQLVNLFCLNLSVEVPVTLIAADDQRDVYIFLGLVFEAGLGLVYLSLQALHLQE